MTRFNLVSQILALIAAFTFAGQARADRSADLSFLFQNLDEYPNLDFYLKYRRGSGPVLLKVEPGTPLRLEERQMNFSLVSLIAVPRGQAIAVPERHPEDHLRDGPLGVWQRNAPPGGWQSKVLKGDGMGASLPQCNGYDITYRVRIDGDQLEVEWVESNLNSWWSTARLIAILVGAACVLIPIVIVTLVVALLVRLFRTPSPASSDTP